jgi:hypothetical protein
LVFLLCKDLAEKRGLHPFLVKRSKAKNCTFDLETGKHVFKVIKLHIGKKTVLEPGLPDFSWCHIPKREQDIPNNHKIYQMPTKYTKRAIKYTNIFLYKALKITNIGIFGLKIFNLATLLKAVKNCNLLRRLRGGNLKII